LAWSPEAPAATVASENRKNGYATASLCLALVPLIPALIYPYFLLFLLAIVFFVTSTAAIGFGMTGLRRARLGFPGKRRALAGVIVGSVELALAMLFWVLLYLGGGW
jgi:hypothetical protein